MFRVWPLRHEIIVAAIGCGILLAGASWLSVAALHGAVSQIAFDALLGVAVLVSPIWFALRHRQHRREIEQEKARSDTAIDHMPHGLVMFDPSQRIALVNRRYVELYGLSPEIVRPGLPAEQLMAHRKERDPSLPDDYGATILTAVATGKINTLVSRSSSGQTVRIVNTPLQGGGWVSVHEDITENRVLLEARERAERIAREQKLQLDTALDNMTQGLCMFDADGRIVLFNRRYSEFMGESAEFLQGRSLLELFKRRKAMGAFPEEPDVFFSRLLATMREGKTTIKEVTRGDSILRVVDQPMNEGGWVATYEDITERRRAEQERDRNRKFLDLIIDNVPSAIFVKSAIDRTYVLVNRACERLWGVSRDAMIGKTAEQAFPDGEAKKIGVRDTQLLKSGLPLFDEREILTIDEQARTVFSRRLMIHNENNKAQYVLGVIDDVTERKATEARIARLAHYDPLTDLPNRLLFREQLEKELALVRRGRQLAVHYLDLDHFKSINDTLGHPVGDELLKRVAHRLRGCLRETDLIARLGGDEFSIIQTGLHDPQDAEMLARRLREAVTESSYDLNGHQTTTDLSIGIALAPGDGTEIDELVKHADLALYGAKTEGRGGYRFYEPEMNARMKRRRQLETDLRSAIANGEFQVYYQPLVNLQSGAVAGCESLLRWIHPLHGMIPPLEFIPVAEETGLINPIGEWVLRQACMEAARWPSNISVAVNISPVQFRNPGLALIVAASLKASGLPAGRLELEVTESVLMQNNDTTLATLHQIRDLGVRISMDDFGTGYSSLSYLRRFPFDKIKIDRSFIGDLPSDEEARSVVRAILTLAGNLKMATTAEGVETIDQKELLSSLGCNQMQGFLYSPPRPGNEIAEFFRTLNKPSKVA